jgi:hypothetical protein
VPHEQTKEAIRLLLIREKCAVVIASEKLRQVLAEHHQVRAAKQGGKKTVDHLEIHPALVAKGKQYLFDSAAFRVREPCTAYGTHQGILLLTSVRSPASPRDKE